MVMECPKCDKFGCICDGAKEPMPPLSGSLDEKAQWAANNMAYQLLKYRYKETDTEAAILLAEKVIQAYKEVACLTIR